MKLKGVLIFFITISIGLGFYLTYFYFAMSKDHPRVCFDLLWKYYDRQQDFYREHSKYSEMIDTTGWILEDEEYHFEIPVLGAGHVSRACKDCQIQDQYFKVACVVESKKTKKRSVVTLDSNKKASYNSLNQ